MLAARRMLFNSGCHTAYTDCDTFTDDFNRADAGDGTLGSASGGHSWLTLGAEGTWTTQGLTVDKAQARVADLTVYHFMTTVTNAHGNDQDVSFDVSCANDDGCWLWVRTSADTSRGYIIGFHPYSPVITKVLPGGSVNIGSLPSLVADRSYAARVRVKGNSLKVWLNDVLQADLTIDPDDTNGNCETSWAYLGLSEAHGNSGGSAPSTYPVRAGTWFDDLSVAPPAALHVYTDDFDRADSTSTLGTTSDGNYTWSVVRGTAGIDSSSTAPPYAPTVRKRGYFSALGSGFGFAVVDAGTPDVDVSVETDGQGTAGLLFRYVDNSNYWAALGDGLYRVVGGSFTQVIARTAVASIGWRIRVVGAGNSIDYYVDGQHIGSTTSSVHNTATKHGLYAQGTADRFDNFDITT